MCTVPTFASSPPGVGAMSGAHSAQAASRAGGTVWATQGQGLTQVQGGGLEGGPK